MPFNPDYNLNEGDLVKITRPDKSVIFMRITSVQEDAVNSGVTDFLTIDTSSYHKNTFVIDWHNCYSFGNGVESNRIRDVFNKSFITPGVSVSTMFEDYKQERLENGLIYSGLYNSTSSTNNLNQFIQAEKITKNLNPVYGSIQKLHARDTDLITLCEDKIIKILANKDAVYNADGNAQLVANQNVLGQSIPFVGEYGISKNPESFSSQAYRTYFTDKARGAVIRLSKDGLTAISDHGMKSWFRDNLKLSTKLIGSYDDRKDEYNITLKGENTDAKIPFPTTVSFKENVTGWVSFKSFVPEHGVSCNNNYYTFSLGRLYIHHEKGNSYGQTMGRNIFYGVPADSSFTVLLNDSPGVVKTFHTLNYEGTQSRVNELITYDTYIPGTLIPNATLNNPDYYNLSDKNGWYVESVITDQEEGSLSEFIEKEGKWFNYIRGKVGVISAYGYLSEESVEGGSFQGLGMLMGTPIINSDLGCTDPTAYNYNSTSTIDDGSCVAVAMGCTSQSASNYDAAANTDDGTCTYPGCTDSLAFNYNPTANVDDGSCTYSVYGCTDPLMYNYSSSATIDDGSCIAFVYGCIDATASNYNPLANTDDGSCTYIIYGCMTSLSCNYNPSANTATDCYLCGDATADNYDDVFDVCPPEDEICLYCTHVQVSSTGNSSPSEIEITWDETWGCSLTGLGPVSGCADLASNGPSYKIRWRPNGGSFSSVVDLALYNSSPQTGVTYTIGGLLANTDYEFQVRAVCENTNSDWSTLGFGSTSYVPIPGCIDQTMCNYNASANVDDGSCIHPAGCSDPLYLEYDPITFPGGVSPNSSGQCDENWAACVTLVVNGCTDSTMFNYDPLANTDDGSCIPFIYGCMDSNSAWDSNYPAASNYNANAGVNTDDGSCNYNAPTLHFSAASKPGNSTTPASPKGLLNMTVDFSLTSSQITNAIIWGFIGINNGNMSGDYYQFYNNQQNHVSSGNYANWGGANGWPQGNNNPQSGNVDTHNLNITESGAGTQIRSALMADHASGLPEGTVSVYADANNATSAPHGITVSGIGYQSTPTLYSVLGIPSIFIKYGCLDSTADTYDVTANVHWAGDCTYSYGCTDPTALNYDPAVIIDDGSCFYANEFNGSTVNNTHQSWKSSAGGYWEIGFGAPNIKQGINIINATNYSETNNPGDKDKYVVWARFTNSGGYTFIDNQTHNTTATGWMRVTKFISWSGGGYDFSNRTANVGNFATQPNPSWDYLAFSLPNSYQANGSYAGVGGIDGIGATIEIAVFPIIDRSSLPTDHPEYLTTNANGSRLTVPTGADLTGNVSAGGFLAQPPNFPTNIYTFTIT